MIRKIYDQLCHLGVTANYTGFFHAAYAIYLVVDNPRRLLRVTKNLYPEVAKHYYTSAACVERNIRTIVELAWKNNRQLLKQMAMYNVSSKPTPSQFIAILASSFPYREPLAQNY